MPPPQASHGNRSNAGVLPLLRGRERVLGGERVRHGWRLQEGASEE